MLITVVITVLITVLKSLQQQAFLCLSFGSTAKVSLHFIAPLNVTASRLLASLRHQLARAPFHKFQYARAFILPCLPSFPCHYQHWRFTHFFSHQRFLSHVSAESKHLPESVTYSYQQGVSTRYINKVYQQAGDLPSRCVIRSCFLRSLSFLLTSRKTLNSHYVVCSRYRGTG